MTLGTVILVAVVRLTFATVVYTAVGTAATIHLVRHVRRLVRGTGSYQQ